MLRDDHRATVRFHPLDPVTNIDVAQATLNPHYSSQANKALLTALGIDEIPVLITPTTEGMILTRGTQAIIAQLGLGQRPPRVINEGEVSRLPDAPPGLPDLQPKDGCQVSVDCPNPANIPGAQMTTSPR